MHDPDTDTCDYEYSLKSMNPLILNFGLHGLTFQKQILNKKAYAGDSSYALLV